MSKRASTSSADSPKQQIKYKHSCMVRRLSKHFDPALKNWDDLLVLLSNFLDPVDLYGKDNNFIKICDKLMANGTISLGSYDKLYEVINSIDVRPAEIIQETSVEIKDIESKGPSETKRPRTGEGDQTKDRDPKLTMIGEFTEQGWIRRSDLMKESCSIPCISTKLIFRDSD
ncbi:uncharacterized protein LOC110451453 isoform X1 [Mizuhopecten yessoensis]|uniref:uncharacterized protein LOC110451453 isoform X1 n=1 Tax=Mizuhopecten yessoensis TaxID=6573 RepID=UPI000B458669|nr:uncharacterized protein LOC110451453 isoform X1 [Mizuhopecten yessoensis]